MSRHHVQIIAGVNMFRENGYINIEVKLEDSLSSSYELRVKYPTDEASGWRLETPVAETNFEQLGDLCIELSHIMIPVTLIDWNVNEKVSERNMKTFGWETWLAWIKKELPKTKSK